MNLSARGPARALVLACLAAQVSAAPPAVAAPQGALQFEPCTLAAPGLPISVTAQCAQLDVPLDRGHPGAGHIELAVAKISSNARRPRPDPVFMLAGGPGQGARESYPAVAAAFRDVLRDRDVILVDQRGTGGSHPLDCAAGDRESAPGAASVDAAREAARECRSQLDVDPVHFTTTDAIADLEGVRGALGAREINLVGVSYGTRVALEYVRRHPDRIRTIVLDGVVPPTLALGADHGRNLDAALAQYFDLCAKDRSCATRFPQPRRTLDEFLASLRRTPLAVTYRDPWTDESRTDELTAERVAGVTRLYAYVPTLAALLPYTLTEAAHGRPERLMAQASMMEGLVGEQINLGLQLAVTCTEDAPLLERLKARHDLLLGQDFVASVVAQCDGWPRGHLPGDFHAPLRADTPALLLSGEFDPVTPPRYGNEVVATLSHGRHLVARGQGHNVMVVGCVPRLIGEFVRAADSKSLDARCMDRIVRTPPFGGSFGWEP